MDRARSPHARTRFHGVIARHLRTGGLLNYGEFIRLAKMANVEIVNADRPIFGKEKCARCGRKLGVAYRVGDALYGAKCAVIARKGEDEG